MINKFFVCFYASQCRLKMQIQETIHLLTNWPTWLVDWLIKNSTALRWKPVSELQSVTCHTGSHTVTCHPTQINVPALTPARQAGGTRFSHPGRIKDWVDLGVGYMQRWLTCPKTVNNPCIVITWQRLDRELNPRLIDPKSNTITYVTLPCRPILINWKWLASILTR